MHHFNYNYEDRLLRQDPKKLWNYFGLTADMTVIDVGCNDGFFGLEAAKIINQTGSKFYGIDLDDEALKKFEIKLKQNNLKNFELFAGPAEEVIIDGLEADIALYATVLHDFSNPEKVLKNTHKMLSSGGVLINYDWRKDITSHGPPFDIRFDLEKAVKLIESVGFKIIESKDYDQNYYFIKALK